VVAALLATTTSAVARSPGGDTYRVWLWNVAGWMMHGGSTTTGLVAAVTASIRDSSAQLVAVNELCGAQYTAIRAELARTGWSQPGGGHSHFEPHTTTACGGDAFGLAIFSRAPLGPADRFALADDGREPRRLLCAPLAARPRLRFCTTHLTPFDPQVSARQVAEVRGHLDAYHAAGDTVVLAGDLNVQPHVPRLDDWYSRRVAGPHNAGNTGAYRELDDTDDACPGYGEATTEGNAEGRCGAAAKIDFILVREDRITGGYRADALPIPRTCRSGGCSDHRILTGTLTLAAPGRPHRGIIAGPFRE
jgi:endonuclease/exonuclease/phosphatase family metal-dependent hydrolase